MAEVRRMSPVRRMEICLICADDFMEHSFGELPATG